MSESDSEVNIPESVNDFVISLNKLIEDNNTYDLQTLYETTYNEISDRYYQSSSWPNTDQISDLIENNNEITLVLYKELYFRHIYARMQPSISDRLESFQNYIQLFNIILGLDSSNPEFELPVEWLWDITDEFVYQFQTFQLFRSRSSSELSEEEINDLKRHEHVWSAQTVMRYLHAFVRKSHLGQQENNDEQVQIASIFKTIGSFALVELSRINVMLGDYFTALQVLSPLDMNGKRSVIFSTMACSSTLYYNMGFSYMMLRRYGDAINILTSYIAHYNRNQNSIPRSYQQSVILKRIDQMHTLLAMSSSLNSQRLDDNMNKLSHELLTKLQNGDVDVLEELFASAAPKFFPLYTPSYDSNDNIDHQEKAFQLQAMRFRQQVDQHQKFTKVYSHLKLCTTVSLSKLATFLDENENDCISSLMCVKHQTNNLHWIRGVQHNGELRSTPQVEFYVSNNMIHVSSTETARRYGEFFIRNILKFEDMIDDINSVNVPKRNKAS